MSNIDHDAKRFNDIIRGKIRKNLKDLITQGHIIGKKGKDKIAIPIPYVKLPKFRHGKPIEGEGSGEGEDEGKGNGVGQGPGQKGTPIGPPEQGGEGEGKKAGEGEGEHPLEVDITIEELAKMLQEELELPNIKPKGKKKNIFSEEDIYKGLRRKGPDALFRFQHSYLEAIRRQIASEEYNPEDPIVIITKEDMRYLSWKKEKEPIANAVIIYMMDVSGSMSGEHRDIARKISFWVDTWIKSQYKEVESVYVIHDYEAQEVDEKAFYESMASGGTRIFSAYELANQIIDKKYPQRDWNIYMFQYSDGDNWGTNNEEIDILDKELLQKSNLFCYGQIDLVPSWASYYSDLNWELGEFKKELDMYKTENKGDNAKKLVTASVQNEGDIYQTLKTFLGTGK